MEKGFDLLIGIFIVVVGGIILIGVLLDSPETEHNLFYDFGKSVRSAQKEFMKGYKDASASKDTVLRMDSSYVDTVLWDSLK